MQVTHDIYICNAYDKRDLARKVESLKKQLNELLKKKNLALALKPKRQLRR